jgi:hypothetical protein
MIRWLHGLPDLDGINMNTSLRCYCLTAAVLAGLVQAASAADIVGRITLKGTPPPEIPLPFDADCAKLHTHPETTHFYLVGPNSGLGDVFVYIKEGAKPTPPPSEPKILDQIGCEYVPYIFGIHTGQKLIVRNSDPGILHNVHVLPKPGSGNKEENQAQLKGQDLVLTFDHPEVLLHFKCDVHIWMHAYAGVLDHPYYAVTAKDGTYKIANVPPGKYVLEAYHRKAGKQTKEITLSDQNQTADFTFQVPAQ